MMEVVGMEITPATFRLPEGHVSVGAFANVDEARSAAHKMLSEYPEREWALYIMDKRGAWEIIRQPQPIE